MIPLRTAILAIAISSIATASETADLNKASGRIFKLDLKAKSFELLKETEYDLVTLAGRSRFTVY